MALEDLADRFTLDGGDFNFLTFILTPLEGGGFVVAASAELDGLISIPELFTSTTIISLLDADGRPTDVSINLADVFEVEGGVFEPAVAALPGGGFVVAARFDAALDQTSSTIKLQVFDAAGGVVGAPVTLSGTEDLVQPRIEVFDDGSFVVTASEVDLFADTVSPSLALFRVEAGAVTAEAGLPLLTLGDGEYDVEALEDGGLLIARVQGAGDASGEGLALSLWPGDSSALIDIPTAGFAVQELEAVDLERLPDGSVALAVQDAAGRLSVARVSSLDGGTATLGDVLVLERPGVVSSFDLSVSPLGTPLLSYVTPTIESLDDVSYVLRVITLSPDLSVVIDDVAVGTVPSPSPLDGISVDLLSGSLRVGLDADGVAVVERFVQDAIPVEPPVALIGGPTPDVLRGGNEDDLIEGGMGSDRLFGGNGDDTLRAGGDLFDASATDTLFGGDGNDVLELARSSVTGERVVGLQRAFAGDGDDRVLGSDGRDEIGGGVGADTLSGFGGRDILYGGFGGAIKADKLDGGFGSDTIFGGDGNDDITGDRGNDIVFASLDDDRVSGGLGADTLYGGDGTDTLMGDQQADLLFGGAGDDVLDGGAGADRLYGGQGGDTLAGGGGADIFFFGGAHGADTVVDFNADMDTLFLANTAIDFTSVDDIVANLIPTLVPVDGVFFATGDDSSVFLQGVTLEDLARASIVFD